LARRRASAKRKRRVCNMTVESKIHIIGVGSDGLAGLTGKPRELLQTADLILGSEPTLELVKELAAQRLPIGANLPDVVQTLETHLGKKRMVVVAGGDPL